jgi:hypothetical protein
MNLFAFLLRQEETNHQANDQAKYIDGNFVTSEKSHSTSEKDCDDNLEHDTEKACVQHLAFLLPFLLNYCLYGFRIRRLLNIF